MKWTLRKIFFNRAWIHLTHPSVKVEKHLGISLPPVMEKVFIINWSNKLKEILIKPKNFLKTLTRNNCGKRVTIEFAMAFLKIIF